MENGLDQVNAITQKYIRENPISADNMPSMLAVLAGHAPDGTYDDGRVRVVVKDGQVVSMEGLPLKDVFIYQRPDV